MPKKRPELKPGKAGTIPFKKVTSISMVAGGEKSIKKVIHAGVVKEWVGIGWVTIDDKPDPDKFPIVAD